MIIALASPRIAVSMDDGLEKVRRCMFTAAEQGAEIVCFPEAYLPGLHGVGIKVLPFGDVDRNRVEAFVSQLAREYSLATILGTEAITNAGRQIAAVVFDSDGQIQGRQIKTQLDPSEDQYYVPGNERTLFRVNGIKFGVSICHEGWRYPETVRWAAVRGAKIVFHPQRTGSDDAGVAIQQWGAQTSPYYEKAMMCRALENTIYFASVNYAMRYQEAATSLITPTGLCQAYLPYGTEGVLVQSIDVTQATGLLASRFAPDRY
jgi:predicted amidohydrolase